MSTPQNLQLVLQKAQEVINMAQAMGVVITIDCHPRTPLAMGSYDMVATTRVARNAQQGIATQECSPLHKTPQGMSDADPNAPWLGLAHRICCDAGIAHGNIADRLSALQDTLEGMTQDAQRYRWLFDSYTLEQVKQAFDNCSAPPSTPQMMVFEQLLGFYVAKQDVDHYIDSLREQSKQPQEAQF